MRLHRWLAFGLGLTTVGCHTFRPLDFDELASGMEVRARISAAHADRLTDYLPNERDRVIEGTVLSTGSEEVLLHVPVTTRNVPGRREILGQRLGIPLAEILEVELKELDRTKTGALTAAGALVLGIILRNSLGEGGGGSTPGPGGPGPQDAVLVRLPIGW